jgi:hypothetical protein
MSKSITLILGVVAFLSGGTLALNSYATPQAVGVTHFEINSSVIEKAACGPHQGFFTRCPGGEHWQAGECVPCAAAIYCVPMPPKCVRLVRNTWRCVDPGTYGCPSL